MPDEDNPFMVNPKPAKKEPETTESFGTDEIVSFMVSPDDASRKKQEPVPNDSKPHWEDAGTPIWDRKNPKDIHNPDYEVVDHEGS